jgi:hypothetical protein
MIKYHASKYRFDKFDFDKIGTGQELNRHAHGIYLGEKDAVSHYLGDYAYLDDADISECGNKGIAYRVNVPSDIRLADWEEVVPLSLINEIGINLIDRLCGDKILASLEKQMVRAGLDIDNVDDIDSFIDELSEKAYYHGLEEDTIAGFVDEDHIRDFITRKVLGDNYTSGDYDDDFTVDDKFLKLLEPFASSGVSIEQEFTWKDMYAAVKNAIEEVEGPDFSAKKTSEFIVEHGLVDAFDCPCVYGKSETRELVIISKSVAEKHVKILEVEHSELADGYENNMDDESLDLY